MPEEPPSIEEHYDRLADVYKESTENPLRKHRTWPATTSLLPEIQEQRILDAGCGPGVHTAWLADQGGDVLGIDVSAEMVAAGREAFGDTAEFRQADLRDSLEFLDTDEFDIVLCQLTLSHVRDLAPVLEEFARVLRSDGAVVLMSHHPFYDFQVVRELEYPDDGNYGLDIDPVVTSPDHPPIYPAVEEYRITWGGEDGKNPATYYRRSLSDLVMPVLEAGFTIEELIEPYPDEEFQAEYPDAYDAMLHRPPELIGLRGRVD